MVQRYAQCYAKTEFGVWTWREERMGKMSSFLTIKRSSENVKLESARVTLKPGNSILLTPLNTLQRKLAAHSAQNAQFPLLKGSLLMKKVVS